MTCASCCQAEVEERGQKTPRMTFVKQLVVSRFKGADRNITFLR